MTTTATCRTPDCTAAGVVCILDPGLLDPGSTILCGTCGQPITDVTASTTAAMRAASRTTTDMATARSGARAPSGS